MKPIQLIVIHGWGGTFIQAIHTIKQLNNFEVYWQQGAFIIPRRIALIISELLSTQNWVKVSMHRKDGGTVHVRKSIRPEPNQDSMLKEIAMHS